MCIQVYAVILKACAASGKWMLASEVLDELEESSVPVSGDHFEKAIQACDKKGKWQESLALLRRLQNYGFQASPGLLETTLRTALTRGTVCCSILLAHTGMRAYACLYACMLMYMHTQWHACTQACTTEALVLTLSVVAYCMHAHSSRLMVNATASHAECT